MTARSFRSGFTLIEVLVAVAVFATMAALAYGGLDSIARTRAELSRQEDQFRALTHAVETLTRDIGETVARPVAGATGAVIPAFVGTADHVEFTRLGFANPQAEQRSNLERVFYELDTNALKRGRFAVLDRAQDTSPILTDLHVSLDELRLRYLTADGKWFDTWPPPETNDVTLMPRAVQWNMHARAYGELEGVVELTSQWPPAAPQ